MMLKVQAFYLLLALGAVQSAAAQETHGFLRKGDRAYDRDQYKEAEQQYRNAADRDVRSPKAVYNLGNTLYQQGKFEEAGQRYHQSAARGETLTRSEKADTWHNQGNALLKQRKYQDAVKAYEQSLRYRPADQETKMNLQMAKKKLQEEQKQQQEQQQKNQQQQENQNQQQNPSQQPNQPQQKDKNQRQNPEHQENQQGPPQPQQPAQQQQMKKEEAKRLLETAIGNEDRKNARKYRAAEQSKPEKRSKKDW
ncbi:MAG TPA: aerotolerance regulator BatC [Saprospirales bacterium]|nr:aerotolerance regulator BatC [Saprospirales bacterium]